MNQTTLRGHHSTRECAVVNPCSTEIYKKILPEIQFNL